jgi:assimilatory nitrate reductase catalytic subunit
MRPSQAFIAMHWGQEYLSGRASLGGATHGVNSLTQSSMDPSSKQPELKHAAVKILKAELPWRFLVFGWADVADAAGALALQMQLRPYLRQFAYASCTLFGDGSGGGSSADRTGVLLRAADDYALAPALLREIEALFGITGTQVLRYDDSKRGNARRILVQDGKLAAVALSGDIAAGAWLRQTLVEQALVAPFGRLLLSSSSSAPQGFKARGKVVCSCFNVARAEIDEALLALAPEMAAPARLAALQERLKCGTNCGSCIPELKQIVASPVPAGKMAARAA